MREKKIILSRVKDAVPKRSMLDFDDLAWNIADGKLFGKRLDESGNEQIVEIGGGESGGETIIISTLVSGFDGGFAHSVFLDEQTLDAGNAASVYLPQQFICGGSANGV